MSPALHIMALESARIILELVGQVCVFLALIPLVLWVQDDVLALMVGRTIAPLRMRYRQCFIFGRDVWRQGLPVEEAIMLAMALCGLFSLLGLSLFVPSVCNLIGVGLADPLLMGSLLLVGAGWAMPERFWATYGRVCLVLCLTESFLVLAAPGVTGLLGVHRLLLAEPGSSLAGCALCCAMALAVAMPLPTKSMIFEAMAERAALTERHMRDQRYFIIQLFHAGWSLLIGDLLIPVLFGMDGLGGIIGLLARFCGGIVLVALGQLTGMNRHGRVMALLLGLAALMALAGRFAV